MFDSRIYKNLKIMAYWKTTVGEEEEEEEGKR